MGSVVDDVRNVIILGSGPAGYTAALYAARANLRPLVLKGLESGGQLMLTTDVENYPGFPDGIMGPELMEAMEKQAARFDAEIVAQSATRVDLSERPFGIWAGDTAMEEASFLTKFARKVTIVHRRDEFRASKIMQERALANPKIDVVWNTVVDEITGNGAVNGVKLRNVNDGTVNDFATDGVFMAIGHTPNTSLFEGQLELTEGGYIVVQ